MRDLMPWLVLAIGFVHQVCWVIAVEVLQASVKDKAVEYSIFLKSLCEAYSPLCGQDLVDAVCEENSTCSKEFPSNSNVIGTQIQFKSSLPFLCRSWNLFMFC